MIGTLVNTGAVIAGSVIGLVFKKSLPQKYQIIYFQAVGLLPCCWASKCRLVFRLRYWWC